MVCLDLLKLEQDLARSPGYARQRQLNSALKLLAQEEQEGAAVWGKEELKMTLDAHRSMADFERQKLGYAQKVRPVSPRMRLLRSRGTPSPPSFEPAIAPECQRGRGRAAFMSELRHQHEIRRSLAQSEVWQAEVYTRLHEQQAALADLNAARLTTHERRVRLLRAANQATDAARRRAIMDAAQQRAASVRKELDHRNRRRLEASQRILVPMEHRPTSALSPVPSPVRSQRSLGGTVKIKTESVAETQP